MSNDKYTYHPGESEIVEVDLKETELHDASTTERITEEYLEAESKRMEARYSGLRPGGKYLSQDGAYSPRVTVTLPRPAHEKVVAAAHAEGMSVSKYLRRLIEAHVA